MVLWAAFGLGRNFSCNSVGSICHKISDKAKSLPIFHALTGCDTTSGFHWSSKTKAWKTWDRYPHVNSAFAYITEHPFCTVEVTDDHFATLEAFVVQMYQKCDISKVNDARIAMFRKKPRPLNRLPPTQVREIGHLINIPCGIFIFT